MLKCTKARFILNPLHLNDMTAYEIFHAFKTVCPNSSDKFRPTLENIAHWKFQICRAREQQQFEPITLNKEPLEKIKQLRRFENFGEMPEYMQLKYLRIASCFPGFQVWAAGSRVDGSYVEGWSEPEVFEARELAGKQKKICSDYDFVVHPDAVAYYPLVLAFVKADRLKVRTQTKIKIPMWSFDKLPETEHKEVIRLLNKNDEAGLAAIHNQYRLSPHDYCCDLLPVVRHFAWAVEQGLIK